MRYAPDVLLSSYTSAPHYALKLCQRAEHYTRYGGIPLPSALGVELGANEQGGAITLLLAPDVEPEAEADANECRQG
jgi:hypothetical protein